MDPRWMLMFTVVGSGVSYHYMQSVSTALGSALGNTLGEDIIAGDGVEATFNAKRLCDEIRKENLDLGYLVNETEMEAKGALFFIL